jgi:hypothetical protein
MRNAGRRRLRGGKGALRGISRWNGERKICRFSASAWGKSFPQELMNLYDDEKLLIAKGENCWSF